MQGKTVFFLCSVLLLQQAAAASVDDWRSQIVRNPLKKICCIILCTRPRLTMVSASLADILPPDRQVRTIARSEACSLPAD